MSIKTILRFGWAFAFVVVLLTCVVLFSAKSPWAQLFGAFLLLAFVCLAIVYHMPEGDPMLDQSEPINMHSTHLPYLCRNGAPVCEHCGALFGTRRAQAPCPHSLIP